MELQFAGLSTAKYEYQRYVHEIVHFSHKISKLWKVCKSLSGLLHLSSVSAAAEEAAALASVSLRPLEGMNCVDAAAPARDGAAALLKMCSGWQKPGAGLQGHCILVSPKKFEVDVGYNVDVITAFKQMPTKNYGKREMMKDFIFCLLEIFFPYYISWFLVFCMYLLQI